MTAPKLSEANKRQVAEQFAEGASEAAAAPEGATVGTSATQGIGVSDVRALTMDELSAAFAPDVLLARVGDLAIDESTGEVLEWPDGVPESGRTALLQLRHALAAEQEKDWRETKQMIGRALNAEIARQGVKAVYSDEYHSWAVADGMMDGVQMVGVPAARIDEALEHEIISLDDLERLRAIAVQAYDAKTIRELVKTGDLTENQARFLIVRTRRAGYVRTEPIKREAKKVTREARAS